MPVGLPVGVMAFVAFVLIYIYDSPRNNLLTTATARIGVPLSAYGVINNPTHAKQRNDGREVKISMSRFTVAANQTPKETQTFVRLPDSKVREIDDKIGIIQSDGMNKNVFDAQINKDSSLATKVEMSGSAERNTISDVLVARLPRDVLPGVGCETEAVFLDTQKTMRRDADVLRRMPWWLKTLTTKYNSIDTHAFWNLTPAFTCVDEEAIGGSAFKGVWFCGIDRILPQGKFDEMRQNEEAPIDGNVQNSNCVIYSFTHGPNGGVDTASQEQIKLFQSSHNIGVHSVEANPTLGEVIPVEFNLAQRAPQCRIHLFTTLTFYHAIQSATQESISQVGLNPTPANLRYHPNMLLGSLSKIADNTEEASNSKDDQSVPPVVGKMQMHMERIGDHRVDILRVDSPIALTALPLALMRNSSGATMAERWGQDDRWLPRQVSVRLYPSGNALTLGEVRRVFDGLIEKYALFHVEFALSFHPSSSPLEMSFLLRSVAGSDYHHGYHVGSENASGSVVWGEFVDRVYGCGQRGQWMMDLINQEEKKADN